MVDQVHLGLVPVMDEFEVVPLGGYFACSVDGPLESADDAYQVGNSVVHAAGGYVAPAVDFEVQIVVY